jgi:hypothetical protein
VNCTYCQKPSNDLHRDHVVPRSRGGPDNAFNIVMACQSCNSAKADQTATEWLGESCPADVRGIEDRVNKRLAKDFAKRDAVKQKFSGPKFVAFHVMPNGGVNFIGDVISETEDTLTLETLDAVMATGCGMWWPCGEVKSFPRSECRVWLYESRIDCLEVMLRINNRIHEAAQ